MQQAAALSNLSIKNIRREVASNSFLSLRKNGKILVDRDSFMAWQNQQSHLQREHTNSKRRPDWGKQNKQNRQNDRVHWIEIEQEMREIDGWKTELDHRFNCIDLFSGAGGLSCGLMMAGFGPLASAEIMPEAIETYQNNFKHFRGQHKDFVFKDITQDRVKQDLINSVRPYHIHLIAGGFPCQGFSMAGHRIVCDQRNSLYLEMLDVVSKILPDFVLMENVEGLRSMLGGEIEKKIIEDYKKIGYAINITTLNAADYGVPQTRKRVIFIGNKLGLTNYHPKPFLPPQNHKTVADAVGRFVDMPEDKSINHIMTKHAPDMLERIKKLEIGKSLYGNYSDAWKKVAWDKPSCTVKENHGGVNIHPLLNRVMTPRELAALQSFPDDFIFYGSKKWQLVQIGNAVPPLLGKAIGLAIIKSLKERT
ncbi:DNA (cytosine-5-)-methyltransferase [Helicobacter sp. 12S02634-8]|nr:DNA (cytosine-5-)-methyltransferase [Helicobacter sp. 12S02634-8]